MKNLLLITVISLLMSAFCTVRTYAQENIWSEQEVKEFIEVYEKYLTDRAAMKGDLLRTMPLDTVMYFLDDELPDFKKCSDKVLAFSFVPNTLIDKEITSSEGYNTDFSVFILTHDNKAYRARLDIAARSVFSIKEIIESSGAEGDIALVYLSFDDESFNLYISDLIPYTPGWNEIDGGTYFITSDGTIATRDCIIKGTRYKFCTDGKCLGKYTGWTKNSNGKRYRKDGKLLKNTRIITKSGKVYVADKNGYVV